MANVEEEIKLHAIMDRNSRLHIADQDGREFEFKSEHELRHSRKEVVQIKVDIEYPHWPLDRPFVEVTFRVPLKVESEAMISTFNEYWRDRYV